MKKFEATEDSFTLMQTENEDDGFAIQINKGVFTNVIYKFGKIKISENDDNANISFDFTPLKGNLLYDVNDLYGNKELEEIAGQILKYMLEVSVNDAIKNVTTKVN